MKYYPQMLDPAMILSYTGIIYEYPVIGVNAMQIIQSLQDGQAYRVIYFAPDGVVVVYDPQPKQ